MQKWKNLNWLLGFFFHDFADTVDEKKLAEQILSLKKEKSDALTKMSELQKQVSHE